MISTIIIDLSEVLLTGLFGVDVILASLLKVTSKAIAREIYGDDFFALLKGEIREDVFWKNILGRTHWHISITELMQLARNNFTEIAGTRIIVEEVRKNYKLGLLSNHAREWIACCEKKFAYEKLFDSCLYSFEVGACKPNKRIYGAMLARLEAKPQNCLFIDDNQDNILAAKQMGLTTIQFTNSKQLKLDLQKLSIHLSN